MVLVATTSAMVTVLIYPVGGEVAVILRKEFSEEAIGAVV